MRKVWQKAITLMLIITVTIPAIGVSAQGSKTSIDFSELTRTEQDLFALINRHRKKEGLKPYKHSKGLAALALYWSNQQAEEENMYHNPNIYEMVPAEAFDPRENVAYYVDDQSHYMAETIFEMWRKSKPHNGNMLCENAEYASVALVKAANGMVYATFLNMQAPEGLSCDEARNLGEMPTLDTRESGNAQNEAEAYEFLQENIDEARKAVSNDFDQAAFDRIIDKICDLAHSSALDEQTGDIKELNSNLSEQYAEEERALAEEKKQKDQTADEAVKKASLKDNADINDDYAAEEVESERLIFEGEEIRNLHNRSTNVSDAAAAKAIKHKLNQSAVNAEDENSSDKDERKVAKDEVESVSEDFEVEGSERKIVSVNAEAGHVISENAEAEREESKVISENVEVEANEVKNESEDLVIGHNERKVVSDLKAESEEPEAKDSAKDTVKDKTKDSVKDSVKDSEKESEHGSEQDEKLTIAESDKFEATVKKQDKSLTDNRKKVPTTGKKPFQPETKGRLTAASVVPQVRTAPAVSPVPETGERDYRILGGVFIIAAVLTIFISYKKR